MANAGVDELKKMIVDLRLDLVRARIPKGHCPYAYYQVKKVRDNCDECDKCEADFYKAIRKKIEKEVAEL